MKALMLAAAVLVAAPATAQSGKTMTRADFETQQTRKYQRYDLNADGTLTPEELLKARPTRMDGTAYTIESVRKSLAKKDANSDGKVTVAEAVATEMPRFAAMDANKDGKVTPEEKAAEPK
ncbi:hypothetical protein M9980_00235 [Sphingomonas donggukensis]|uniref:EF-hand domain-containing protein n=1 Tax=Sphingomonas donggukensis TaxID=2949093 RepID=A0ABY4TXG2_9SPHN|nr:hypothetical protein [Sphingomonas donggukensis]URW77081.1 hypothetical protein M9980_00235 [Sphingomonas donggukensis]